MSDKDVTVNVKGLEKLAKALSGRLPLARVGILGDKDVRSGNSKENSNAAVGAAHEFGTSKLPIRSFLRVPLTAMLNSYLEKSRAFDKKSIDRVIAEGSLTTFIKKIALVGENVVADAFATGGFGKWQPSNMAKKKNEQTLVETQQLRNSITSDVK